jgi:hypothetical protein
MYEPCAINSDQDEFRAQSSHICYKMLYNNLEPAKAVTHLKYGAKFYEQDNSVEKSSNLKSG